MMGLTTFQFVEVVICFAALAVYYIFYVIFLIKRPHKTALGTNIIEQQRFVKRYMIIHKNEVTASALFEQTIFL